MSADTNQSKAVVVDIVEYCSTLHIKEVDLVDSLVNNHHEMLSRHCNLDTCHSINKLKTQAKTCSFSVFSTSASSSWCPVVSQPRSRSQVVVSTNLLSPRHPVDHDVRKSISPPPPHSEIVAVESDAVIPVQSLLRIISLQQIVMRKCLQMMMIVIWLELCPAESDVNRELWNLKQILSTTLASAESLQSHDSIDTHPSEHQHFFSVLVKIYWWTSTVSSWPAQLSHTVSLRGLAGNWFWSPRKLLLTLSFQVFTSNHTINNCVDSRKPVKSCWDSRFGLWLV